MSKVLIVDNSERDAQRLEKLLAKQDLIAEVHPRGADAEQALVKEADRFVAAFVLWDLPGSVSGFDLLVACRNLWPDLPVVVMSNALDASMATRAFALNAKDFLEKPIDSERLAACVRTLLAEHDPLSELVERLRKKIIGDSPALLATLKQVGKIIPDDSSSVLIMGESGTGKELLAQAIHTLGPRASNPWVAVNVGEIPATLIESALFGHEKGAFTGATERHIGFFEEARGGTIFLDEIGDLDLALQSKLLRVIQQREFRRLKGVEILSFTGRLLCATNRDLAVAVNQGEFRRDLFHRIAEVIVPVPPLRERKGDIDLLLPHFLEFYKAALSVKIARETWTILRSYPFLGNIRELQNLVKTALISSDGSVILPQHLPLQSMGTFMEGAQPVSVNESPTPDPLTRQGNYLEILFSELKQSVPENWLALTYREAQGPYVHAFDRLFLKAKLEHSRYNITQAAREADVDTKTFRRRWKECGLPQLEDERD